MIGGLSSLTLTSLVLVGAVIFVNGLTDAPNSIATCITTRCLSVRQAVVLSAVFNFLGVLIWANNGASVTETVINMVNFGGDNRMWPIALCSAMFSIVLWAVTAWYFGIPTSESHALISGITGSALSVNGNVTGINGYEWIKSVYGLVFSCVAGLVGGIIICRIIILIFRNTDRSRSASFFRWGQILSASAMSFMHGAQDGQKFIAVLIMCLSADNVTVPSGRLPLIIICSLIMALGTLSGGKKIIKSVGVDMVRLQRYEGFGADAAGAVSLFFSTRMGFPVSTTHAKTMAMVGASVGGDRRHINPNVIKEMALAWVFTFPGCGMLSFLVTKIFLKIF